MKNITFLTLIFLSFTSIIFAQRGGVQIVTPPNEILGITTDNSTVGVLSGELSVSDDGSSIYNIPIDVPKGVNNVAPKLSIVYNSSSSHGIAGNGWNFSGLSVISRIKPTIHHDGFVDAVNNDNEDRFALDGQRLILKTGVYGQAGSTYETENFSTLKVSLFF